MPLSGKEMQKRYEKAGWQKIRQKGSHVIMAKGEEPRQFQCIKIGKRIRKIPT